MQRPAQRLAQRHAPLPQLRLGDDVLIATAAGWAPYRLDWSEQGPYLRRVMKVTKKPQVPLATEPVLV